MIQDRHLYVLVTLDIRNAFNSAPWHHIDSAASRYGLPAYVRRLIRSYLSGRRIMVPGASDPVEKMSCGVPQGSVLGPTLWNMF